MANQTNETPVLFVQSFADDVTMDNAFMWAMAKDFPEMEETDEKRQVVAAVRGLIRNPAAATKEDRKVLGARLAGAGMICEAVAELLNDGGENLPDAITDHENGEIFEDAAELLHGVACFVIAPDFVAKATAEKGYPFPFVVEAMQAPNEFTQTDYMAFNAVLDEARKAFRALREERDLQNDLSDDFTGNDYAEDAAVIGLIKAALPLPCEVMAERGEYYADENGGEA